MFLIQRKRNGLLRFVAEMPANDPAVISNESLNWNPGEANDSFGRNKGHDCFLYVQNVRK